MRDIMHVAGLILFLAALAGAWAGMYIADINHDEAARRECVGSGGEIVEVHNARPSGWTTPWMCQR